MVQVVVQGRSTTFLSSVYCFDNLFSQQTYIDGRREIAKGSILGDSDCVNGSKQAVLCTAFVLLRLFKGVNLRVVEKLSGDLSV